MLLYLENSTKKSLSSSVNSTMVQNAKLTHKHVLCLYNNNELSETKKKDPIYSIYNSIKNNIYE